MGVVQAGESELGWAAVVRPGASGEGVGDVLEGAAGESAVAVGEGGTGGNGGCEEGEEEEE